MKEIPLTRGLVALVDDESFDELSQFKWYAVSPGRHLNYAYRAGSQGTAPEAMHRRLLPDAAYIDHRNGNGLDNRRSNLRPATHQQNMFNRRMRKDNTSGLIGVQWDARRNRWRARVKVNGTTLNFGRFKDPIEAALARDAAARELHGDFAKLNFP